VLEAGLDEAADLGEVTIGAVALLGAARVTAQAGRHRRQLLRRRERDVAHVAMARLARCRAMRAVIELERRRRQVHLRDRRTRRIARMTRAARHRRRTWDDQIRLGAIDRMARPAGRLRRDQVVDRGARGRRRRVARGALGPAREVLGVRKHKRQALHRIHDRRPLGRAILIGEHAPEPERPRG
jgi:hypothetical protein